jgi:hypothetical protein
MLNASETALLVIRIWCEEGSDRPFRGELRIADDVASAFRSTQTFVRPDALIQAARDFVDDVVCPPAPSRLGHISVTTETAG